MKVFISWSGVRSKAVAQTLYIWLNDVIQAVEPWLSTEEIRKGKQWGAELTRELETTDIGVICLTPENLTAPWLLFEAGALSKLQREKNAHVCTYLIDMPYTAVTGPLETFQHTLATEEDTLRMAQSINAAIEDGHGRLTESQLKRAFERCWLELKQCLETLPPPQEPIPPPRRPEDMLQEVLELVRGSAKSRIYSRSFFYPLAQFLGKLKSREDLNDPLLQTELRLIQQSLEEDAQYVMAFLEHVERLNIRQKPEILKFTSQFMPVDLEKLKIPDQSIKPQRKDQASKGQPPRQGKRPKREASRSTE